MKKVVPQNLVERMDPKDRKALGLSTISERKTKQEKRRENELRNQVLSFCSRHQIPVGTSRPDRKSTYTTGWPDLSLILPCGVTLYIELKTLTKQSEEQRWIETNMLLRGHQVYVVTTYERFVEVVKRHW